MTGANQVRILTDEFSDWGGMGHLVFKVTQSARCPITTEIDIKPGSYPNCFNIDGHGVVPVAILGSSTFIVDEIDLIAGLDFGGLKVRVKGNSSPQCSIADVNTDGFDDMVCQFADDNPESWTGGADEATVTGQLNDGTKFSGTDSICVVP